MRARAEALANKPHMLLIIRVLVLLLKLWLHGVQRTSAEGVGAQRTSAQRVGAQRSALQYELSLITLWLWRAQRPSAACCCASPGLGLSLTAACSMRLLRSMLGRALGVAHEPSSCLLCCFRSRASLRSL